MANLVASMNELFEQHLIQKKQEQDELSRIEKATKEIDGTLVNVLMNLESEGPYTTNYIEIYNNSALSNERAENIEVIIRYKQELTIKFDLIRSSIRTTIKNSPNRAIDDIIKNSVLVSVEHELTGIM